jgi:type IV pilus assembly protein PilV
LLVLSVGLLGLAGLQNESLRQTYNAYLESQALFLAEDMIDRMRLSPTASLYSYDFSEGVDEAADCIAASCDSAEAMAAWNITDWVTQIENLLPSGKGSIESLNEALGEYSITISYDDVRGGNRDTDNPQPKRELRIITRI